MLETLDVGCGYRQDDFHYFDCRENVTYVDLQVSSFNKPFLDVQCSGQFLPFRNKSFNKVFSRLVIEYADDPELFLRELIRVAWHEVIVITPHRFSRLKKAHVKHQLSKNWFHKLLQNYVHNVTFEFGLFRLDTESPVLFTVPKFIVVRVKVG